MHQREYLRIKKQIEAEYLEKLRALDLVWALAGKDGIEKKNGQFRDSTLANAVRLTVERMDKSFTLRDVVGVCQAEVGNGPVVRLASISGILKRMADRGAIKVVELGSGRRPTTYSKS